MATKKEVKEPKEQKLSEVDELKAEIKCKEEKIKKLSETLIYFREDVLNGNQKHVDLINTIL